MSSNGKRRSRRAAIEVIAPAASPPEAAAIAAALERFLHDTAPAPSGGPPQAGPWERTALAEGVGLASPDPWSDVDLWASAQAC